MVVVAVRMKLLRQLFVGLGDQLKRGKLLYFENRVVVFCSW